MTTAEMLFGTKMCPVNTLELSKAVGVSPGTIRNWKKDPNLIPWGKMKIIARIRRLTAEDLEKMTKERSTK